MLKTVKREKFPLKMKIYDSNWNKGIMIGNTIIFTAKYRKETKQIKKVIQHDNDTHGFYVEYKNEPGKIFIIYRRRN